MATSTYLGIYKDIQKSLEKNICYYYLILSRNEKLKLVSQKQR